MKTLKKVATVLALGVSIILIGGCKPLSGQLTLMRPLDLVIENKSTCLPENWMDPRCSDSSTEKTLPEGRYRLQIFKISNKVVELRFKGPESADMTIELPPGSSLPSQDGPIYVDGSRVGQNWNMLGKMSTDITRSEPHQDYEVCYYSVERIVCLDAPRGPDDTRRGRDRGRGRERECRREAVSVQGRQFVEYFYRYTHTVADLEFVRDQEVIGTYRGELNDSEKIYTFQGRCQ